MGAWGMGPFDNDTALDYADEMTTEAGVAECLRNESYPGLAIAAGEVIAASCGAIDQPGLYQSEGTGLIAMIMVGGDQDEARAKIAKALGGEHYLPEEIAVAARSMSFDAQACAEAVMRIRETCLEEGYLASWRDPAARRSAIEAVIARIEHFAPDAVDVPADIVADDDCV